MIVEFSVGNFWSFKEIQTLQMQAAKIKSKFPKVDEENVFKVGEQLSLLKSKAIYGANASGKSNLLRAFTTMRSIVKESISNERILEQSIIPFKLNEVTVKQPTFFQLIFILGKVQYRYGFEATKKAITAEWLFGKPLDMKGVRERYFFLREGEEVEVNGEWFKEGAAFAKSGGKATPYFRNNSLFLTVVAAFNGAISLQLVREIVYKVSIVSGLEDHEHLLENSSIGFVAKNEESKQKMTDWLNSVDPSIRSIELIDVDSVPMSDFPKQREVLQAAIRQGYPPATGVAIYRSLYDESGKETGQAPLILSFQEGEGTKKFFALSPLIYLVLEKGGALFIDEFDARLHPRLTRKIVQLFHSSKINPNNAQLIFVTHDSTLLDARLLRRDQIAFAKKDKFGASELFSLVEFKGVRNDASFEKDYLSGSYGATPNNLNVMESAMATSLNHA